MLPSRRFWNNSSTATRSEHWAQTRRKFVRLFMAPGMMAVRVDPGRIISMLWRRFDAMASKERSPESYLRPVRRILHAALTGAPPRGTACDPTLWGAYPRLRTGRGRVRATRLKIIIFAVDRQSDEGIQLGRYPGNNVFAPHYVTCRLAFRVLRDRM